MQKTLATTHPGQGGIGQRDGHHTQGLGALIIKNGNNRNNESTFHYKTVDVGKKQDGTIQLDKNSDLKSQNGKDTQSGSAAKNTPQLSNSKKMKSRKNS